ncbi:MAG TPA: amidohydrolase family protein [Thermoleophilaceae bacterium]|nr:amidohydrolase family protein [Thermoleophilaceae bacterium]
MTFDVHAHVVVPEITREAGAGEPWRPRVYRDDGGAQVVELGGKEIRAAIQEFVDVDAILAAQDDAGVDRVLLCPWVPLLYYDADPQEGLRRARIQNDALAALVHARPERIAALGALPLQDAQLAAGELHALMDAGALRGVEVAASVRGVFLGDDRFEPFWAAAEASGALVFVHPTTRGFDSPAFQDYYLWNTVANPLETAVTAAHMVAAGLMERHPRLRVLLAHGGGALMAVRGRLRHAHGFQPQASARLSESPDDSIRRFYFDSLTHDDELLRALIDYAGSERVLLGSDYPFDMGDARPADAVRRLGLAPDVEAAILAGNAERLLGPRPARREETIA